MPRILYDGPNKKIQVYSKFMIVLAIFFLMPLAAELIWPAGLVWDDGRTNDSIPWMLKAMYIALSICIFLGAKDPVKNEIIIDYAIISSVIHGSVMLYYAVILHHEHAHLYGDVPLLLIIAIILYFYHPRRLEKSAQ